MITEKNFDKENTLKDNIEILLDIYLGTTQHNQKEKPSQETVDRHYQIQSDFVDALEKMYNLSKKEREEMGRKGSEYVQKNYHFKDFEQKWIDLMQGVIDRFENVRNEKRKNEDILLSQVMLGRLPKEVLNN